MTLRPLLAAVLVAAALAPAPAAVASCHHCVDEVLTAAGDACRDVNDALRSRMHCPW